MSAPHVAVVVLSWNGRDDTLACLASLAEQDYEPLTAIVVDNASTDGTAEAVRERFPEAQLVVAEWNRGFAGGNNLGLERAQELGADHVLVLNNDTELEPGAIAALVGEAARRPDAGSLGAKLVFADDPGLIWFAGATFDPRRGYNGRVEGYRERDDGRFDAVREIDRACGAAMLVPRPVLDEVGGFDEQLGVAYNDVDLCLRLRARGLRNVWTPFAELYHFESVSRGRDTAGEVRPGFLVESRLMHERWGPLLAADPYFNPNLSLWRADFGLAYPPRHPRRWWEG